MISTLFPSAEDRILTELVGVGGILRNTAAAGENLEPEAPVGAESVIADEASRATTEVHPILALLILDIVRAIAIVIQRAVIDRDLINPVLNQYPALCIPRGGAVTHAPGHSLPRGGIEMDAASLPAIAEDRIAQNDILAGIKIEIVLPEGIPDPHPAIMHGAVEDAVVIDIRTMHSDRAVLHLKIVVGHPIHRSVVGAYGIKPGLIDIAVAAAGGRLGTIPIHRHILHRDVAELISGSENHRPGVRIRRADYDRVAHPRPIESHLAIHQNAARDLILPGSQPNRTTTSGRDIPDRPIDRLGTAPGGQGNREGMST